MAKIVLLATYPRHHGHPEYTVGVNLEHEAIVYSTYSLSERNELTEDQEANLTGTADQINAWKYPFFCDDLG